MYYEDLKIKYSKNWYQGGWVLYEQILTTITSAMYNV